MRFSPHTAPRSVLLKSLDILGCNYPGKVSYFGSLNFFSDLLYPAMKSSIRAPNARYMYVNLVVGL
jgi:hypothetical protein